MYTFLQKKKNPLSIQQFFYICKMYTFDQYFGSKTRTLTQQNRWLFFSSTSFAYFV